MTDTTRDDAPDPMPVFVLKGKDVLAPGIVDAYRRECRRHGLDEQAAQVGLAFREMAAWQARHPELAKLPDHQHVPVALDIEPAAGPEPGHARPDVVRAAVDDAARVAGPAVTHFAIDHASALARCTPRDHDQLKIRVALMYLFSLGLIELVPGALDAWLPVEVQEPYATDLRTALDEAVTRQAEINAALQGGATPIAALRGDEPPQRS